MSVQRLFNGKYQSLKAGTTPNTAVPNAGGSVAFVEAGTSTNKNTYSDYERTTANANPVILDNEGRADIYLETGFYDVTVKDSDANTILTISNVTIGADATETASINQLPNGSFETSTDGTTPDNWVLSAYTGGTVSRETSDNGHGQYAMKFVSTGTGGGTIISGFVPVTPQQSQTLEWLYKSTVADVRNDMNVYFYDAGQTALTGSASSTSIYSNATSNTTTWAQSSGDFTPPTDARWAKVEWIGCNSADITAGTTWLDNVRLRLPRVTVSDDETLVDESTTDAVSERAIKSYVDNNGFSPYRSEFLS